MPRTMCPMMPSPSSPLTMKPARYPAMAPRTIHAMMLTVSTSIPTRASPPACWVSLFAPKVRAARRTVGPGRPHVHATPGRPGPNNGVTPGPPKETGRQVGRGVVRYGDGETTSMLGFFGRQVVPEPDFDHPPAGEQATQRGAEGGDEQKSLGSWVYLLGVSGHVPRGRTRSTPPRRPARRYVHRPHIRAATARNRVAGDSQSAKGSRGALLRCPERASSR